MASGRRERGSRRKWHIRWSWCSKQWRERIFGKFHCFQLWWGDRRISFFCGDGGDEVSEYDDLSCWIYYYEIVKIILLFWRLSLAFEENRRNKFWNKYDRYHWEPNPQLFFNRMCLTYCSSWEWLHPLRHLTPRVQRYLCLNFWWFWRDGPMTFSCLLPSILHFWRSALVLDGKFSSSIYFRKLFC